MRTEQMTDAELRAMIAKQARGARNDEPAQRAAVLDRRVSQGGGNGATATDEDDVSRLARANRSVRRRQDRTVPGILPERARLNLAPS